MNKIVKIVIAVVVVAAVAVGAWFAFKPAKAPVTEATTPAVEEVVETEPETNEVVDAEAQG